MKSFYFILFFLCFNFCSTVNAQSIEEIKSQAFIYFNEGKFEETALKLEKVIEIYKKNDNESNPDYSMSLYNLALTYTYSEKIDQAINCLNIAKNNVIKNLGINHSNYYLIVLNLGFLYHYNKKDYNKALNLYFEATNFQERNKHLEINYEDQIDLLNNIGMIYNELGDNKSALDYYLASLKLIKQIFGTKHPSYAVVLNNLSILYIELEQLDKAFLFLSEALENGKINLGINHPDYATRLNNLGLLYSKKAENKLAIENYLAALEIYEKNYIKTNLEFGNIFNNLGLSYTETEEYGKAFYYLNEALKNKEINFGKKHSEYIFTLNNLALLYSKMGKYNEGASIYLSAIENIDITLKQNSLIYGKLSANLANLYNTMGQHSNALTYFQKSIKNSLKNLQKNYTFLTEKEKEKFNKTIINNSVALHSFTYQVHETLPETIDEDFWVTMTTKGLLLSSNINIREAINEQNNPELNNLFNNWNIANNKLDLAYSLSIEERKNSDLHLDSLIEEANELERLVVKGASTYIDYPINYLGKEEMVESLKKGEIAIQFNSFKYYNKEWTDSTIYVAYILNSDGDLQYIPLFEQDELLPLISTFSDKNSNTDYLTNLKAMYKLIWQPLEPHLTDANKIYYAPSGLLNKVPFYALIDSNNHYLGEQSKLHAMLSLRDLVKKDKEIPQDKNSIIALFGGADFDFGVQKDSEEDFMNDFLMNKPLNTLVSNDLRSGWTYLKGTLAEIEQIEAISNSINIECIKLYGENASEENFKKIITENKPKILHIATHGYYISPTKKDNQDFTFASLNNNNKKNYDEPLLRSGVLLSGANRKWVYKQAINTPDDGIVTALEISRMNLQNTELVVLSACETGLGDIKHSEGVMGLQRAFKMAGAKRQIISLWEVPDKETSEMMVLFYKALFEDELSYYEAFNKAQTLMKNKYPKEPIKWAGFILIE